MSQANHTWDKINQSPNSNMKTCSKMQLFYKNFKASQLIAKRLERGSVVQCLPCMQEAWGSISNIDI